MELHELIKLLRFSDEPIMLHAANEIERLTRERDEARDAARTLLRSPHARACDPQACWKWLGD